MSAEVLAYGLNPPEHKRSTLVEADRPRSGLERVVSHLDQNWQEEGLSQDWHKLRGVGFNMDSETALLTNEAIPVEDRARQNRRNLLGFTVEYLQGDHVYPVEYNLTSDADGEYLYDFRYKKRMRDTASHDERNGSVSQSLGRIEGFLASPQTSEGAIAVMPSPTGSTGLRDNDGDLIYYPDSYWFVFQKGAEGKVKGFGLRTDLTLAESSKVIQRLTGKQIPIDAPIEEYVSAIALISIDQGIRTPKDFIDILRESRNPEGENLAYKDKGWDRIYQDINRGEDLYEQELEADQMLDELEVFVKAGNYSELELQKRVAATVLRLSKLYLIDRKQNALGKEKHWMEGNLIHVDRFEQLVGFGNSYGRANEEAKKIDGCAGGNKTIAVDSVVSRLGLKKRNWNFDKDGTCQMCSVPFSKLGPCGVCESCNDRIDAKEAMSIAA